MANNLVMMDRLLYKLKKEYGFESGAYYRLIPNATNLMTGSKSQTKVKYPLNEIIILPKNFNSLGFYPAPYLKAGREFAYNGYQDIDSKQAIIDGSDLPDDFELQPSDYIIYDHKKYEVVDYSEIEQKIAYLFTLKRLVGAVINEEQEAMTYQNLIIRQVIGVSLNGS